MKKRVEFYMSNIRVALLQLQPTESVNGNLRKGITFCREAKAKGADIALFPEMWNCGYCIPQNTHELNAVSISANENFITTFKELAKDLNMAIGITFLERFQLSARNSVCLIDRFGQEMFTYSKVHTCDFGAEKVLTPGEDFFVANLNTENGTVKIGCMICYDREFPESARILMLKGAEIILVPNACPMEINRISQLRGRAFENMVGIATVNYPDTWPDCNGHSTAFDGIAYKKNSNGSRDTLILETNGDEGVYFADFPIDEMREYRNSEVHGNAYRRSDRYKLLVSEEKQEPFIREDFRR